MALPLVVLEKQTASQHLGTLWRNFQRSHAHTAQNPPTLLLALPPAWDNRYQVLLYGQAASHGVVCASVAHIKDLAHISWPGPVVLHAHWFASVFAGALSDADADALLDKAITAVEAFRTRTGARLLWSAHNVFPHGNLFPETYMKLRRWIFERFDMLHVMDDSHVAVLEKVFDRPAPAGFCVPHMTYHGAVPDSTNAAAARSRFGIGQDAFVFGAFGSLQRYKNLDKFLDAFAAVAGAVPDRPLAVLAGGVPSDADFARELVLRFGDDPRVTLLPRKIEDAEIQYLHHAADVMVMPYRDTLNSGAALMAATFARPFVMPQMAGAAAMVPLGGRLYDPAAPDALRAALESCLAAYDAVGLSGPVPEAIAARSPRQISEAFMTAVMQAGG